MLTQLLPECPFTRQPIAWKRQETSCCKSDKAVEFQLSELPEWSATPIDCLADLDLIPNSLYQDNLWLSPDFTAFMLEESQGVSAGALLLRHIDGYELLVSLQLFRFQAGRQIRQAPAQEERFGFRRRISNLTSFNILTLGQFMVSGTYGWSGQPNAFSPTEIAELLHVAGEAVAAKMGGIPAVLIKDLVHLNSPTADNLRDKGYFQFPVDPSMQLELRNWNSFDDYLLDISSKYRVRYRRARKHGEAVTCRELSEREVVNNAALLHALYCNIKADAAFDAISLSQNYFAELKKRFPHNCRIFGYYHNNRLIGFRSTLANATTLHAHYLGFDQDLNRETHLYHNILFDLLEEAIDGQFAKLDYGRTALEIKSSIGAEPIYYLCSLRGRNRFIRYIVSQFTPALFRATEWKQRRPFK